jgi:hypothetical protein
MTPPPPLTALKDLDAQLDASGWAVLDSGALCALSGVASAAFEAWLPHWHALPPDRHLRDGGRYRRRRHGCFLVDGADLQPMPHRPHWQPVAYNALHGGIERHFDPIPTDWVAQTAWRQLLVSLGSVASGLRGPRRWFVEAHPFRIDASEGIGRPTPEGAHRDGVDLVAVVFVGRQNVKGGETRVFDARGPQGVRFTLREPFSVLLLDDERVIHETTPIQPLEAGQPSWRDTLVLTYRQGAFQGPDTV